MRQWAPEGRAHVLRRLHNGVYIVYCIYLMHTPSLGALYLPLISRTALCRGRRTYRPKLLTYQQHIKPLQKTLYMIHKRPREEWDPISWEIPLQPLPTRHTAH